MSKIFLKLGKLSRSFFIFACPFSWRSPHEPRIHDQGPLVSGLPENTVRNLLYGPKFSKKMLISEVNLQDLDADFGLQRFKLCLFVNVGDEETNS